MWAVDMGMHGRVKHPVASQSEGQHYHPPGTKCVNSESR